MADMSEKNVSEEKEKVSKKKSKKRKKNQEDTAVVVVVMLMFFITFSIFISSAGLVLYKASGGNKEAFLKTLKIDKYFLKSPKILALEKQIKNTPTFIIPTDSDVEILKRLSEDDKSNYLLIKGKTTLKPYEILAAIRLMKDWDMDYGLFLSAMEKRQSYPFQQSYSDYYNYVVGKYGGDEKFKLSQTNDEYNQFYVRGLYFMDLEETYSNIPQRLLNVFFMGFYQAEDYYRRNGTDLSDTGQEIVLQREFYNGIYRIVLSTKR